MGTLYKKYELGYQNQNVEGEVKVQNICMQLKLSCYQLKVDCYNYKIYYVGIMVITKQKPTVDTQKIKRRKSKHTTMEIISSPKKTARQQGRNKRPTKQPENNKMASVSPYLSIIT